MNRLRIVIDVLLFLMTILLMNFNLLGILTHEVLGIIITIIIIIHLILNFKWIKNITINFKNVKKKTKILYFIDLLILINYAITITIGICISTSLFNFKTSSSGTLMLLHHIFGRVSAATMLIHLGFHFDIIIRKISTDKTIKALILITYITISVIYIMYLIFTLTNTYIWRGMI